MLQKIALTVALIAVSSFATWDYFPVLDAGKGTAKANMYYDWDGDWSQMGIGISARYTVAPNVELALMDLGYQFWNEEDCKGCADGGDGLRDLTFGLRYQIVPIFNVFLDANLPIGSDEVTNNEFSLYFGGQFSQKISPIFVLGTEGGFLWGFEHDKYERGLVLEIGAEGDFPIPSTGFTPFVGLKLLYQLTESSSDGHDVGGDGDNDIQVSLGAKYDIDTQMAVDGKLILRSGDDSLGGNATGIAFDFYFNF
ncbi:MAG: transporter [Fibrobacteraceae bacterium]|nr:transporter [Fibrobacteraceae bacterium]